MKKALKIVGIVLLLVALGISLVTFGVIGFVSWVWGGIRFTPDAAMEAIGIGASEQECLQSEGLYFYYSTFADLGYTIDGAEDWIYCVTPVKKNGLLFWKATPDPRGRQVYAEEGGTRRSVGQLVTVEADGKYHHFFLLWDDADRFSLCLCSSESDCLHVTVNGNEEDKIAIWKHSYFVTDTVVEQFAINGTRLTVETGK